MPIDAESLDNFRRGSTGDSFLGIIDLSNTTLYLALAERQDGAAIDRDRHSTIGARRRDPLPGAGGHAQLATWAGVHAAQVGAGAAVGNAIGFSIVKTGLRSFTVGTFRSGFNSQYIGEARPGFAAGGANEARTLAQDRILNTLLPELTAGLAGTRQRRGSI